ncbi:MAG: class I SAM-dependent methyltransferase [Gemmatimonadota bacterium]
MAENRTLDLDELDRPDYRTVLEEMDRLLAADPISYLHPGKRWEYPWALERAGLPAGARVLDVGSGDSIFPVYLARQGHQVTAVDLAFDGTLGERHGVPLGYARADMTSLPLPAEAFDAVFCLSVIEHLPDPAVPRALAELRRVLRPGKPLLLTTDYYDDAEAEIWHRTPEREFRVDWRIFDEARLRRLILDAPGWRLDGALDLDVDWDAVKPRMRAYHGYPYTSVAVKLIRT